MYMHNNRGNQVDDDVKAMIAKLEIFASNLARWLLLYIFL